MGDKNLRLTTYLITGNDSILDEQNHITPEVRRILEEIRPDVVKGRKYLIKKLNKFCLKYPKVPVFKNLLSTIYQNNGDKKQAFAVNQWLVKEHPDYLFGKLNLAAQLLVEDKPESIPDILGETMEIGELYPERKEFHVEEVISFNNISLQYFLAMDEIEQAEMRVEFMEDVAGEHSKTLYAKDLLENWYFNKASELLKEEEKLRQNVGIKGTRSHLQTTHAPKFHFAKEIGWLYQNDLSIETEKLKQILELDLDKLIEDLEKVLQDSIFRFDHFSEMLENEAYNSNNFNFPTHALFLLAELKSETSLPVILQLLKQDRQFNELWFGDSINQVLENVLYHCGKNQTKQLFDFLKLPNIFEFNKAYVGESLAKIIDDSSKERNYFIEEYREVLNVFIDNAADENYADPDAIGFIISDIVDLGLRELLPEIKKLFDLEIVGFWICGDYEEIEEDIIEQPDGQDLEFIKNDFFKKYRELSDYETDAAALTNDENYYKELFDEEILKRAMEDNFFEPPLEKPNKIGRNDPCPCGSGKKYKKCCML